jgi:hypothetical protein
MHLVGFNSFKISMYFCISIPDTLYIVFNKLQFWVSVLKLIWAQLSRACLNHHGSAITGVTRLKTNTCYHIRIFAVLGYLSRMIG